MEFADARERMYMREIASLLAGKSVETLGGTEQGAIKSISLEEIKKRIDGADHDEPRLMRALDHMVHTGAIERRDFAWRTTPQFARWRRALEN
jgi:hypothetical protein